MAMVNVAIHIYDGVDMLTTINSTVVPRALTRLKMWTKHASNGLACVGLTAVVAFALAVPTSVDAQQAQLPIDSTDKHLGVATCAGSTCHGAAEPFKDSPVLQNEFVTWHGQDKHAQAYKVLLSPQSKRIAVNLGIGDAHTAKECLVCHTDYVDEAARGKRFQLSDGVGCEACHGGAEKWLGLHVTGEVSHEQNVKAGLYPTENPTARASLCLSCHLGNVGQRVITHRIMGAGHPRLSFELDTFTIIEPLHFVVDDDYAKRKPLMSSAQVWALGQLSAASTFLETLGSSKHQGIFPELVYFDCQSCHHPMSYGDVMKHPGRGWSSTGSGLGPGVVRLNDSTLLMVTAIAAGVSREMSVATSKALRKLHRATTVNWGATTKAAAELRNLVIDVRGRLGNTIDTAAMQAMLTKVLVDGRKGRYRDYAAAEQGYLALDSLLSTLDDAKVLSAAQSKNMRAAMDNLYLTLRTHEKGFRPGKHGYRPTEDDKDVYKSSRYVAAMKKLAGVF
ncbi:MAG: hypothetical protein HOI95_29005 [Chromatiales bacterium]|jgi:hypothetical protein|nr:hypothetical protein [Chromatiales bacterium]